MGNKRYYALKNLLIEKLNKKEISETYMAIRARGQQMKTF